MENFIYGDIVRVKSTGILLHYLWGDDIATLAPDIPGHGKWMCGDEIPCVGSYHRDQIEYVGHREGYMVDLSPSHRGRQEFTSSREAIAA